MTRKEIYEEVLARGFQHIADQSGGEARVLRWINQAYREIIDHRPWAFLEASKEGTSPLEVADLGHVLSVSNLTHDRSLTYIERAVLLKSDPSLEATGTATLWFHEDGDTIRTHPVDSSSTLLVRYLKVAAPLAKDADEPIFDADYHDLIVDGAAVRGYKSTDNFEAAGFVRQEWERGLRGMTKGLRVNYDSPRTIVRAGTVNDYL